MTTSDYYELGIAQSIRALSIKVEDMKRELAALRLDVGTLLFLLKNGHAKDSPPSRSEDAGHHAQDT